MENGRTGEALEGANTRVSQDDLVAQLQLIQAMFPEYDMSLDIGTANDQMALTRSDQVRGWPLRLSISYPLEAAATSNVMPLLHMDLLFEATGATLMTVSSDSMSPLRLQLLQDEVNELLYHEHYFSVAEMDRFSDHFDDLYHTFLPRSLAKINAIATNTQPLPHNVATKDDRYQHPGIVMDTCIDVSDNDVGCHASKDPRMRVLFWMHHIKAPGKRRFIVQSARALHLCGIFKSGYPGAIVLEGASDAILTFIHDIKRLNWQAIQVRDLAEINEVTATISFLPDQVIETDDLSEMTQVMRQHNLEEWFLRGMKIK